MSYFRSLAKSLVVALIALNGTAVFGALFTTSHRVVGVVMSSTPNQIVLKLEKDMDGTIPNGTVLKLGIGPHNRIVFEDPNSRSASHDRNPTAIRQGAHVEATYDDGAGSLTTSYLKVLKSPPLAENSKSREGERPAATGRRTSEIRICNKYSRLVSAAVGYPENGIIKTQGWWDLKPGQCAVVDHYSIEGPYYVHAHSVISENRNEGTVVYTLWGLDKPLTVLNRKNFKFDHADKIPPNANEATFTDIGHRSATTVTYTVSEGRADIATTVAPAENNASSAQRERAVDPREMEKLRQQLKQRAEKGDANMQYWLGITYFADKDFKRGAPWIRKAADQGLLMAQTKLAACYLNGEGVEKDLKTAAFWYRKAAAQGDSESQAWLKEHPSLN